jgi:hypothetical protein
MEPAVNYPNLYVNDAIFVRATRIIGGHDAVEKFLACRIYLLSTE